MDDGDLNSKYVRKVFSVSSKFSYQMRDINYLRPVVLAPILFFEKIACLLDQTNWKICGSMGEGTQYPFKIVECRDIYIIQIYPQTLAVENTREKDQYGRNTYVYLTERENCPPGYCLLRLLNDGSSSLLHMMHFNKEINGNKYIQSSTSRAVMGLLGSIIDVISHNPYLYPDSTIGNRGERGPAINKMVDGVEVQSITNSFGFNITKIDHVYVIHHPKWPSCASEWMERIRLYGWPSQQQIGDIMSKGIYLAPAGSRHSELEDIQWRYSFNEAEKILVWSFNYTQVKCYVLLKMLVSENVTQRFKDDVISSYHLKTLMFWTIEQTDPQLWVSHNLVQLLFHVLILLFMCVANLTCPSYFIPDENLFVGKVTLGNKNRVCQVLSSIINEGWTALTRLETFAEDHDFIQSLYEDDDIVYQEEDTVELPMIDPNILAPSFCSIFNSNIILQLLNVACSCNINEADKMDENFNAVMNNLLLEIHLSGDIRNKAILQDILAFIRCSYGTHFLSLSRCPSIERQENCIMEQLGLVYTNHSCRSNLSECLAKRANYTYITGDFQSTIATAEKLLNRYAHFPLHQPGVTGNIPAFVHHCEQILYNTDTNLMNLDHLFDNRTFLGCVVFLKNEMYALPDDARVEMFYVLAAESQFQNWFGLSPFLYAAYLAFLVSFDSGQEDNSEAYLRIMENTCSHPPTSNESSSLNLLGVCYVKMRQPEKAMETFCVSLKRQRWRNSAVWHVARLLWRKLQDKWRKTS